MSWATTESRMKIEIGKRYVTRDGDKTGPIERVKRPIAGQSMGAMCNGIFRNWTPKGEWANGLESGLDLIAEID